MQIYWIIVLFFLRVKGDITLSTESSSENSAHCEVSRKEDDEYCGAICYPIVKPLLRYAALCQGKDTTISELKDQIREKNVTIAELQGQLKLAKAIEIQTLVDNLSSTIKRGEKLLDASIRKKDEQIDDLVGKIGLLTKLEDQKKVLESQINS